MSLIIDVLLAVIAVSALVAGYKNGLVKTVLSLVRSIVAVLVAYAFTPYLAPVFYDSFILERIANGIEKTVGSLSKTADGNDFIRLIEEAPKVFTQMLEKYGIELESLESHVSTMSETGNAAVKSVSQFISAPVATVIANSLAFIIIFVAAFIILFLVSKLIEIVFKAPILKTADKLAGLLLGALNAAVVLWVLSIVITYAVTALGAIAPDWFGASVVEDSVILRFFSEVNPLQIIKNVVGYGK